MEIRALCFDKQDNKKILQSILKEFIDYIYKYKEWQ